jgi:DNA-binding transcriptional regulator/RsmH inhibitor MraZ
MVSEENLAGPTTSPDRRRVGESLAPRARFAIPALRSVAAPRSPARWRHWIVGIDDLGQVTLPAAVRDAVPGTDGVRATSREKSLLLRRGGHGAQVYVDRRGRLVVPAWLRRLSEPWQSVLLAANYPDMSLIVLTPSTTLDGLLDTLVTEAD